MAVTTDGSNLFCAGEHGCMTQIYLPTGEIVMDFGEIMSSHVYSLAVSPDNEYLFVASKEGHVKKIDIGTSEVEFDFDQVCNDCYTCF